MTIWGFLVILLPAIFLVLASFAEDYDVKFSLGFIGLIICVAYTGIVCESPVGQSIEYPIEKYTIKELYSTSYGEFLYINSEGKISNHITELSASKGFNDVPFEYTIVETGNAFNIVVKTELKIAPKL